MALPELLGKKGMKNFSLLTFLGLTLGIFVRMLYFQLPAGKQGAWSEKVGRRGDENGGTVGRGEKGKGS